jgi:NAD(P)-dependent dehydrogenase (short-subunit alcohol dehydrogenase family)
MGLQLASGERVLSKLGAGIATYSVDNDRGLRFAHPPYKPIIPPMGQTKGKGPRMSQNTKGKQVAVVIGATSKWQSDGRNTLLAHGHPVDDSDVEVGVRWGVGGAVAQKFAQEGFFTVLTTRNEANAAPLAKAIREQGGDCMIVELDLVSRDSIASAFATIRREAGDPDVLIYNAGYLEGRDLPPEKELLEYVPVEMLDTGLHISARGPFLVAQEVLPAMRKKGAGSFFFSNNSSSLRGKKRMTGQSLYYPRVLMRTLAQVLTEEYSEHGVHVANIVIDGSIDSPGSRKLPRNANRRDLIINPVKIAEAYWYLHTQDKSCWTHELQLTPFSTKPSY